VDLDQHEFGYSPSYAVRGNAVLVRRGRGVMSMADLSRGTYTGQFAFVYIEPKNNPGQYDHQHPGYWPDSTPPISWKISIQLKHPRKIPIPGNSSA